MSQLSFFTKYIFQATLSLCLDHFPPDQIRRGYKVSFQEVPSKALTSLHLQKGCCIMHLQSIHTGPQTLLCSRAILTDIRLLKYGQLKPETSTFNIFFISLEELSTCIKPPLMKSRGLKTAQLCQDRA